MGSDSFTAQDEDVLTEALKEFGEQYPSVLRPLIEERDEYMVWTLRRLATKYAASPPREK